MRLSIYVSLLSISFMPYAAQAQQVKEGAISMGSETAQGFTAACVHGKSSVEEVMEAKMKEAGLAKSGKKSGFTTYKGVNWPAISANKIDVYYKVDGDGRSKANLSIVISKGYDNYITTGTDATAANNMNTFLQKLDAQIDINDAIKKKEADLKALEKESAKQQKEIQKKQDQQQQTDADKAKKNAELNNLKQQN